ncbi:MAG: hypothetical protein A3H95_03400 [Acidobacteria bacterium RIFCSPLOWO2_02_FULL_64_15]|nr:MAG: hypothetical protein A3H95_03400 [Acidobacteria bacterium RIFCSPLOWO2_02_FULL_64_15]
MTGRTGESRVGQGICGALKGAHCVVLRITNHAKYARLMEAWQGGPCPQKAAQLGSSTEVDHLSVNSKKGKHTLDDDLGILALNQEL